MATGAVVPAWPADATGHRAFAGDLHGARRVAVALNSYSFSHKTKNNLAEETSCVDHRGRNEVLQPTGRGQLSCPRWGHRGLWSRSPGGRRPNGRRTWFTGLRSAAA